MKPHKQTSVFTTLIALAFSLIAGAGAFAQQEPSDPGDLYREVDIMSQVLGEKLQEADLIGIAKVEDWVLTYDEFSNVGRTNRIKTQYVPTVGVIFTVPVSFALKPPEGADDESGAKPGESEEETDLWERFSASGASGTGQRDINAIALDGDLKVVDADKIKKRVELRVNRVENHSWLVAHVAQPEYAAELVDDLKRTIIETIAEYGHRMKNLPANERILVIVEGSRPAAATKYSLVSGPRVLATQAYARAQQVYAGESVHEFHFDESASAPDGSPMQWKFSTGAGRSSTPKDRLLFSFAKSNLQSQKTYDALRNAVSIIEY